MVYHGISHGNFRIIWIEMSWMVYMFDCGAAIHLFNLSLKDQIEWYIVQDTTYLFFLCLGIMFTHYTDDQNSCCLDSYLLIQNKPISPKHLKLLCHGSLFVISEAIWLIIINTRLYNEELCFKKCTNWTHRDDQNMA